MKTKAQELLDKIASGEKPNKEDYQEYNNICKAIKSGIESIKNTAQTQNPNPKFLAKVAPILNDLDSYKDKLLAEADCEGLGYHSELREAVFYASIKNQLHPEALVSICRLGESSSLAGNILSRIEDLAVETAAAKSSIKCGCDGLMDYLTGDGNCQSVIYSLELLKRDISKNKVSHKLNNPAGGTGQVKVGEVCIDNLQIRFYGDNPEINPLSKEKTQEGIDFSAANSGNIVLNINVLDKAEKDKKIEAVWGYLGDKGEETSTFTGELDEELLKKIFPKVKSDRAKQLLPYLNTYLSKFSMNSCKERIMFFTQIAEETDNLDLLTEEESDWSSSTSKYKGRGLFQLTGSSNYRKFESYCKELGDDVDFMNKPETLNNPKYAVLSAFWFWDLNNCKKYSKELTEENMLKIAKITNCGSISSNCSHNDQEEPCYSCEPNGWPRRKLEFERLKQLFPCN